MTREEAIKYFKRHLDLYCVDGISREAEEMAIKVLSQEPCDDAVSREAVIKTINNNTADERDGWLCIDNDLVHEIKKLPSVNPQPCDNAISRKAVIQTLNRMDRYTATELTLCDTDKKFPANEVFIVDDVYEQITEQLPSVTQKPNICASCKHNTDNEICLECEFDGITRGMTRYESVTQKSGKWIHFAQSDDCSLCGWSTGKYESPSKYCPNCGAKMESEDKE